MNSPLLGFIRGSRQCLIGFGVMSQLFSCGSNRAHSIAYERPASELRISAPTRAPVGQDLRVLVDGFSHAFPSSESFLTVLTSYGPRIFRSPIHDGRAEFLLSGRDLTRSGTITLSVHAGDSRGSVNVILEPGAVVDPVTPFIGARSITADAKHWSICTVVPFDEFGNPLKEGTTVELLIRRPDENVSTKKSKIEHLLAWERIWSETRAGRTIVAASVARSFGPEAILLEVPGWPVGFGLSAGPNDLPADGRSMLAVRSELIVDQYNNPMLDGTLVTFVASSPTQGARFSPALTIDGVARAFFQAPLKQEPLAVHAVVYNTEVRRLDYFFHPGPAVGEIPLQQTRDPRGRVQLIAGPIIAALGQFVPDGTPVEFSLSVRSLSDPLTSTSSKKSSAQGADAPKTLRLTGVADAGYARVTVVDEKFPDSGLFSVQVRVGSGSGQAEFEVR